MPTLSAPTTPRIFSESCLRTASEQTGAALESVRKLAAWHGAAIRKADPVSTKARLIVAIPLIAQEYGARFDIPKNVVTESIRLVMFKFGHLAVEEIREAYRQFVAGDLPLKKKEAATYGGEFSVSQLGAILAAYSEARKATIAALEKERDAERDRIADDARAAAQREGFEGRFREEIENARRTAETWDDVKSYWYESAKSRGWFSITKAQADEIYSRALNLAAIEAAETRKLKFERAIETGARAKTIARKIAVFELLLGKKAI